MASTAPWTQRLQDECVARGYGEPTYQDISDRRGGRTAWSTIAMIQGKPFSARFWYDGNYIASAKQDAAEVALKAITGVPSAKSSVQSAGHGGRS